MISSIIGLQTAIAMRHNASYGLTSGFPMTKNQQLQFQHNALMYKIASAQEDSYRKLLNKNIKKSFSIFA